MTQTISFDRAQEIGLEARIERILQTVTPKELADMAGVTSQEVQSFQVGERLDRVTRQKLVRAVQLVDGMSREKSPRLFKPLLPLF